MRLSLAIMALCITGTALADDDPDAQAVGAERQRLGNARIQQDLVLREREEQRRLEAATEREPRAPEEAGTREEADASKAKPTMLEDTGEPDMSETLEQLRNLGELKDAGYLSEEEYTKLKQKILDDQI